MKRKEEIANEYLAKNNGYAQAAYDELTALLHKHLPMETEEFLYHCEARMILKKKAGLEPDLEIANDIKD